MSLYDSPHEHETEAEAAGRARATAVSAEEGPKELFLIIGGYADPAIEYAEKHGFAPHLGA